jgi:deferrochelatase/peroxidase EfeB
VLAKDSSRNDNFRYDQTSQQLKCPYAAHTRKTNPRDDLANFGGTEIHRILRRGIQYGPEVTDEEDASGISSEDPALERGLLFACYQSNIANGFQFLQKSKLHSRDRIGTTLLILARLGKQRWIHLC